MAASTTTAYSFLSNDYRDDNTLGVPYKGTSIRSTRTGLDLQSQGTQQFKLYIGDDEPTVTAQMGGYRLDTEGNRTLQGFVNAHSAMSHLDISNHTSGGTINDFYINTNWTAVNRNTIDGLSCIDLSATASISNSTTTTLPQNYTLFCVWYPRVSNSGWRTLWRGNNDHKVIVNNNATDLGMYSNRNGAFRDTGYNISIQWQSLIVVGNGSSATSYSGTQTFYVNGTNVGTTDRVGSGTTIDIFGWSGQNPGYFREIGVLGEALSTTDVATLEAFLSGSVSGNTAVTHFSSPLAADQSLIEYSSNTFTQFTHNNILNVLKPSTTSIISTVPEQEFSFDKTIRITAANKIQPTLQSGGGSGGGGGTGTVEKQIWY